ncbi:MAG: BTAD domain-containing putative transcriptional regulator [Candidatus Manganitrophaceae bacterium]
MNRRNQRRKTTGRQGRSIRSEVSAKVRRPQVAEVYPRRRLFRILDTAQKAHRIAWLAGPPGAGKTTLVSSYVQSHDLPCLWYQVDEGDDDVASFFFYFSQALQVAAPRNRKPLPRLTPEDLPTLGLFARRYFQAALLRFPRRCVWVFDNYQTLRSDSPLHDLLREGLSELPAGVNVVFISRYDPPPAFARWQVHNRMTLLDAQSLKLTLEEAAGIARRLDKRPRNDSIRQIHERTDGWTAGTVLFLTSERRESNPFGATTPQALFDYFAGEIFRHMDTETRRILLESALLPTMTTAAVTQMTGEAKSASLLADLARRNYFTVKRVEAKPTYQFHALFRSFLLREIKGFYPIDRLQALQRRAAALLLAEGRIEDAVAVLHEASAWDELTRLIFDVAPSLAAQARLETLAHWIGLLPEEIASSDPWLLYWLAQSRLMTRPVEARELSEKAFALFEKSDDPLGLYLSWASVVSAHAADWLTFTELDRWLAIFDSIRQRHPTFPSPETEARVTFCMLMILTNRPTGRSDTAYWLEQAEALVQGLPDPNQCFLVGTPLALHYFWIGEMKGMTRVIALLEPVHARHDVAPVVDLPWRFVLAIYYWAVAGKPEKAVEITDEAIRLAEATGARAADSFLLIQGVYASLLLGDMQGAESYFARMQGFDPASVVVSHHAATLIALFDNRLDKALEHSRRTIAPLDKIGGYFQAAEAHLTHAWLLHRVNAPAEAREHLERCRAIARATQSRLLEYFCFILDAGVSLNQGELDAAGERLGAAIVLDKEMGGILAPVQPGRKWTRLYTFALNRGIEVEHVRAMIRKRRLAPDSPPIEIENWPWSYRFYTLGRFSIVKDDKTLPLSGKGQKKPLELLKSLIAFGGREVDQERLTETLWPDAEGDAAQHAFETTLYRLRKFFEGEAPLLFKDGRLSLDARRCWVDCWAFERLLSTVEERLRAPSMAEIEPLTKKLFSLYRGPFLDREGDGSSALSLRERLCSRFLRTLEKCGRFYQTEQAWPKVIDSCLQALEVEPLSERCYQELMIAYHSLGRRAEGLSVYRRCKKTFHALLGVSPSSKTESLRRTLEAASS